jgi:hypothetical protein
VGAGPGGLVGRRSLLELQAVRHSPPAGASGGHLGGDAGQGRGDALPVRCRPGPERACLASPCPAGEPAGLHDVS